MITDEQVEAALISFFGTSSPNWNGTRATMRAALEAAEAAAWQPIETAPRNKYILTATRHYGGWRIQKAHFIEKYTVEDSDEFSEYCEDNDTYYVPEGWYEVCHEHDEYGSVAMDEAPELWRHMPGPPKGDK